VRDPSPRQEFEALTREELDDLVAEPLPERAALSVVNANLAVPINPAIGLNTLSDATEVAGATQNTRVEQGT
jgi:hypothetical protein